MKKRIRLAAVLMALVLLIGVLPTTTYTVIADDTGSTTIDAGETVTDGDGTEVDGSEIITDDSETETEPSSEENEGGDEPSDQGTSDGGGSGQDCSPDDTAVVGKYEIKWNFKWVNGSAGSSKNYEYLDESHTSLLFHPQDWTSQTAILAVEMSFTGEQDDSVPAGSIEIRIPYSVFKGWNGNKADSLVTQIPQAPATNSETYYNWELDEEHQEVVIRNYSEISGNDYFYAEFSYRVSPLDVDGGMPDEALAEEKGFERATYGVNAWAGSKDLDRYCWNHPIKDENNKEIGREYYWKDYYKNEKINCTLTIDPDKDGEPNYYDYSNPLKLAMMTRGGGSVRARHMPDAKDGVYTAWQSTWGAKPEDAEQYVYVVWDVDYTRLSSYGDSQPWAYTVNYDADYPAITFKKEGMEDAVVKGTQVGAMLHTIPTDGSWSQYSTLTVWGGDSSRGYYPNLGTNTTNKTNKNNYFTFANSKYSVSGSKFYASKTGYQFRYAVGYDSQIHNYGDSGASNWGTNYFAVLVKYPISEILQYAKTYGVDLENDGLDIYGHYFVDEDWESGFELRREALGSAKLFLVNRTGKGVYTKHKGSSPQTDGAQTALSQGYNVDLSNLSFDGFNRYPYYMSYNGTSPEERTTDNEGNINSKLLGQKVVITEKQLMLSSAGAKHPKGWCPNADPTAATPTGTGLNGDGNVFLTEEDYSIPRFDVVKFEDYGAAYGAGQWTETGLLPYTQYKPIYIYIRYRNTTEYIPYCAAVKTSTTDVTVYKCDPTEKDENGDPLIYKDKAHTISPVQYHYALPANVTGIQYVHEADSNVFRTSIQVTMHLILHPTDNVQAVINSDLEKGKNTYVKNIADCDVYKGKADGTGYEASPWIDVDNCANGKSVADDVIWTLTPVTNAMTISKSTKVPKDDAPEQVAAGERDTEMAYVRLMAENDVGLNKNIANSTDMEDRYKLLEGTFFELIPKGTSIRADSIFGVYNQTWSSHQYSAASYKDWVPYKDSGKKVNLDGSRYFLSADEYTVTTEYIEELDQNLVRIDYKIKKDPKCDLYPGINWYCNMQFFFILENTYQNIRARGTSTMNYVAFMNTKSKEDSYSKPGSGSVIKAGNLNNRQDITNLFLDKTSEYSKAAGCGKLNIPWNAVTVLEANYTKTVATPETLDGLPQNEIYSSDGGVVSVGNRYTYRLQLTNMPTTRADNIVLYDILESGTDLEESFWKGKFVSVDTSLIEQTPSDGSKTGATCKPVVYYSTNLTDKVDLTSESMNEAFEWDEAGNLKSEYWTTTCPEDPSTVTAIAIDCRKATDGTDFHLGLKATLTAFIHMKAPLSLPDPPTAKTVNGSIAYIRAFDTVPGDINEKTTQLMSRAMLAIRDTDVSLVKASDPKTGTPEARTIVDSDGSGTIKYRLTLRNTMPFDCNDIVVTDPIPDNLTVDNVTVALNGSSAEMAGNDTPGFSYELAEDGKNFTFMIDQQHPTVIETDEEGNEVITKNGDTQIYIYTHVNTLNTVTETDEDGNEEIIQQQVLLRDYDNTAVLQSANGKHIGDITDTMYHRAETVLIRVNKTWKDANDRYQKRPESIELNLSGKIKVKEMQVTGQDEEGNDITEEVEVEQEVLTRQLTVTPDQEGEWNAVFADLPKYWVITEDADFETPNTWYEIDYSITETPITETDEEGETITLYEPEITIKPSAPNTYDASIVNKYYLSYGNLRIVKSLPRYELGEPASFVFDVVGTLGKNPDGSPKVVYSNVAVLTLDRAGEQSALLTHIPAGATITVKEIYTGSSYILNSEEEKETTIIAEDTVSVNFTNDYVPENKGGHGIVNNFTYDSQKKDWIHNKLPGNNEPETSSTEGGGER